MSLVFWNFLKRRSELADEIKTKFNLGDLASQVLSTRFKNLEEVTANLQNNELESPFIMMDMEIAVNRLKKAIENREKIVVYGDYDCDGVCASVMLYMYLKEEGANVSCYIPDREEGYGLNCNAIDKLKKDGVDLIVTVDNGIKAIEEAEYIFKLNIDLIVTDHHNVDRVEGKLPRAVAILNPKRPGDLSKFKDICGAVVVLKLIAAMQGGNFDYAFKFAGDLAAIATIADVVPLTFENRAVVIRGLMEVKRSSNLGLSELLKIVFSSGLGSINSTDLAFKICPIINAAGRLKTANLAFELFTSTTTLQAQKNALNLFELNNKRKVIQQKLMREAENFIKNNLDCLNKPVLVVYGQNWASGLIGLISGALVRKFKKPAVVLTYIDDLAVGSARSFESFCMFEALSFCSDLFLKWGGHNLAGGLTLKVCDIPKFISRINEYATGVNFTYMIKVDLIANYSQFNLEEVKSLQRLEPFGNSNEQPVFAINNLILFRVISLKQGQYLSLEFSDGINKFKVLNFNMAYDDFYFKVGETFNILVEVDINHYCGTESLSFKLVDLRPSSLKQNNLVKSYHLLKNLDYKKNKQQTAVYKPTRSDYKLAYLEIKRIKIFKGDFFDLFCLLCEHISCFKLFVVLRVLVELNLVEYDGFKFRVKNQNKPVDLNKSELIKKWFE